MPVSGAAFGDFSSSVRCNTGAICLSVEQLSETLVDQYVVTRGQYACQWSSFQGLYLISTLSHGAMCLSVEQLSGTLVDQ